MNSSREASVEKGSKMAFDQAVWRK